MSEAIVLVDLDDLVGRAEIAQRARVKVPTIDTWRYRYSTFPEPIATRSGTPLWLWSVVAEWLAETPRDVGRPRVDLRPSGPPAPLPDRLSHVIRTPPPSDDDEEGVSTA